MRLAKRAIASEQDALAFFQELSDVSRAHAGSGRLKWKRLKKYFKKAYGLHINQSLARLVETKLEKRGAVLPSSVPDAYLAPRTGGGWDLIPADPKLLKAPTTDGLHYRKLKTYLHELGHIIELEHPGLICPPPEETHVPRILPHERSPDAFVREARLKFYSEDPAEDEAHPLREIAADNAALLLLIPPRRFGRLLKARRTTTLDLARHFRVSLDDVDRYLQNLLTFPAAALKEADLEVEELKAFLANRSYDPTYAFVLSLVRRARIERSAKKLVDAEIFDLDVEAGRLGDKLTHIAATYLRLLNEQAAMSGLGSIVNRFLRCHSGSELRFLIRRLPKFPLPLLLDLVGRSCRAEQAALVATLATKLGFPRHGLEALASQDRAPQSARLLEARASCELAVGGVEAARASLEIYLKAHELDPEDAEIRFGLAKASLQAEGRGAAIKRLQEFSPPSRWLEDYLIAKIHYLEYIESEGRSRAKLLHAESCLLRALEVDIKCWPPEAVSFLARDDLLRDDLHIPLGSIWQVDGDRKKAINLLAKIYQIRSREEDRPDLALLCEALLLRSWEAHRLDSKTNFCLFEFHKRRGDSFESMLRLRELLHLRPWDRRVIAYLRETVENSPGLVGWEKYSQGLSRLLARMPGTSSEEKGANV